MFVSFSLGKVSGIVPVFIVHARCRWYGRYSTNRILEETCLLFLPRLHKEPLSVSSDRSLPTYLIPCGLSWRRRPLTDTLE